MKYSLLTLTISGLLLGSSVASGATLLEIYEQALENDPQLKADRAALEAGKEARRVGRAALLPELGAQASYSQTETDSTRTGPITFEGQTIPTLGSSSSTTEGESKTWTASLTQPIFNMARWYQYKQGHVTSEQAEVQFGADQQAFILRVANAYFSVLRAIDTVNTSNAEETAFESQLEQARQRFEVGLTAITDVHEAQAAYDTATANTLQAIGNLAIQYEALEVLTGQSPASIAPIADEFPVANPVPADRGEWVNFALENNYSLAAARLNARSSELTAKIRRSAHLPTLGANVSYRHQDSETETEEPIDSTSETDTTSYSLQLNVPIFSGGGTSAQRRQAYQQFLRAEELYNLTQRQTIQNARSRHLFVETSVAQVNARRQAIVSAQSSLEATQAGYEAGTRNLVDVLVAQRTLFQAQRNYFTALYDYIIGTLQLKEVAGNLSPEDIVELNRFLDAQNQISRDELVQ